MRLIFQDRRKAGCLDLQAIEMAVRSAMHHAAAAALSELLQFPAPAVDQRIIPCSCGRQAHYRELRSKPVLTAVGKVKISRPYYWCAHGHAGQIPTDIELDIEHTEFSPGVRRMKAVVGEEAPFDHGREQWWESLFLPPACTNPSYLLEEPHWPLFSHSPTPLFHPFPSITYTDHPPPGSPPHAIVSMRGVSLLVPPAPPRRWLSNPEASVEMGLWKTLSD